MSAIGELHFCVRGENGTLMQAVQISGGIVRIVSSPGNSVELTEKQLTTLSIAAASASGSLFAQKKGASLEGA